MESVYTIKDAKEDLVRAIQKLALLQESDPDFNGWVFHLRRTLEQYQQVWEKEAFRVR